MPPNELSIQFFIPVPDSWSNKKKLEMHNEPHQQKPDIDNLVKGFLDAFLVDDSSVWRVDSAKLWTANAGEIRVYA